MRILIADDELAQSKVLRSLFAAGSKGTNKVRASKGAPDLGRLVVARAPRKAGKSTGTKVKGRAAAARTGNDYLDLGDQPEQAAAMLDALGISLLNRGLSAEGGQLIELALLIRRKFFGNDHPATALSLNSYSRLQRERGHYLGATEAAQDALRINCRVYGESGYPVAASLKELGFVQLLQGLFEDAIRSADTGLGILRNLGLYDTDPDSTRLMDILGRAQAALNKVADAQTTFKTLLALDQQQLGTRQHPKYATHLANFGLVLEAMNKRRAAAKTYINAIDLYTNTLNREHHPNLIDVYANLGSLLRTSPDDVKQAGKYLQKALDLGRAIRGESHMLVGNDYANLARWHYDTGARDAAEEGFSKALDIYSSNVRSRALPADHFFIAETLTWQARIAVERDTAAGGKQAEQLLRQAIDIWPAQLGPNSLGEGMAKAYLGRSLWLQGTAGIDPCGPLCEGYKIVKTYPQVGPAVLRPLQSWIKQQGCDCGAGKASSARRRD